MDKTRTLKIHQIASGYCYNSDSLFLYAFARNFLKRGASLLDLGAGSGLLGLLCARDFDAKITMIDINETHAKLCAKNAKFNGINAEILCGDALDSAIKGFDFIISNPPFYGDCALPPKNHHLFLAKKAQNLPLKKLAQFAKKALNPQGKFIFCYKSAHLGEIFSALEQCGFNVRAMQFIYPKANGKNASLAIFCADFSKCALEILPPIFNFIDSAHSKEAREIFALCNLESVKIDKDEL